jgi:hypothetical protein
MIRSRYINSVDGYNLRSALQVDGDINIRPSLPQLLSRSTQNKYLSELMHKIKEFANLEKIELNLPTQKV